MPTQLLRLHLLYAAMAAAAAIAIGVYYWTAVPQPQQLQKNREFREAVSKISDPEHLKKVVAQVTQDADSVVIAAMKAVDAAIVTLVAVLILTSAAFLHAYIKLRRVKRTKNYDAL